MSKKYSKSPIIEAVCEFRFQNKNKWDWTIPGILYSSIKEKYPIKKEIKGFGVGIQFKQQTDSNSSNVSSNVIEKMEGMQFLTNDKNQMIQIKENTLSIHIIKPYSSWEIFKPAIIECLEKYKPLMEPIGITRIGIRYINKFENLPDSFEIEKFFNYNIRFPKKEQSTIGEIILKSSIPIPDLNNPEGFMNMILIINKIVPNQNGSNHILDLDMIYQKENDEMILLDEVPNYLEKAHENILSTFESIITDEIRKLIT